MDITTIGWIVTATFTLLKPLLSKWAEAISWEIWKSMWEKIKEKFSSNWEWEIITKLEKEVNDEDIWVAKHLLKWYIENDNNLHDFLKENLPKLEKEFSNTVWNISKVSWEVSILQGNDYKSEKKVDNTVWDISEVSWKVTISQGK